MSVEQIVWVNAANFGDIHVSRELVKYAMARLPHLKFAYCHRNAPELLRDIDGLEHWGPERFDLEGNKKKRSVEIDDKTLALNTWYAVSPLHGINGSGFGMTLNTLVELFKLHLSKFDLKITEPIDTFIPTIDFSKFHTSGVDANLGRYARYRRRVLFCNGPAMSSQTNVSDEMMNALLLQLATAHPDVMFFNTTAQFAFEGYKNIRCSATVIGTPPWGKCDLNETAYLGSFCDVIVGRCSGPQSFCYNTATLLDDLNTMVCLNTDERVAKWVYFSEAAKAKIVWSPEYQLEKLYEVVTHTLNREKN